MNTLDNLKMQLENCNESQLAKILAVLNEKKEKKGNPSYAVVHWYNYHKELSAGFLRGFNNLDKAKKFAYHLAKQDNNEVITEDEIDDINGPGKYGSPYVNYTIVGYGGSSLDFDNALEIEVASHDSTFYSVVEWFDGVTNEWNDYDSDNNSDKKEKEWVPRYFPHYQEKPKTNKKQQKKLIETNLIMLGEILSNQNKK